MSVLSLGDLQKNQKKQTKKRKPIGMIICSNKKIRDQIREITV
jgi:hypothetical protein